MDRLTSCDEIGNKIEDCSTITPIPKTFILDKHYRGRAIDKLAQLEDLMEKYGIESVEELDEALMPLVEGNLEHWKSAMFWKMQANELLHIEDVIDSCDILKEKATKENYEKAVALARKLFLGEKIDVKD